MKGGGRVTLFFWRRSSRVENCEGQQRICRRTNHSPGRSTAKMIPEEFSKEISRAIMWIFNSKNKSPYLVNRLPWEKNFATVLLYQFFFKTQNSLFLLFCLKPVISYFDFLLRICPSKIFLFSGLKILRTVFPLIFFPLFFLEINLL